MPIQLDFVIFETPQTIMMLTIFGTLRNLKFLEALQKHIYVHNILHASILSLYWLFLKYIMLMFITTSSLTSNINHFFIAIDLIYNVLNAVSWPKMNDRYLCKYIHFRTVSK